MLAMSKDEAQAVLLAHCQNRGIKLDKRQRNKSWIMSLLAHHHDKGIRDLDELNAGGLREVLRRVMISYTTTSKPPSRKTPIIASVKVTTKVP